MSLLIFFLSYLLFLVIATLIITGFYIITRGEKAVQPDGSVRRTGKIFKRWSLFWEQTTGTQRVYYSGIKLTGAYGWLKEFNPTLAQKISIAEGEKSLAFSGTLTHEELSYIKDVLHCEIHVSSAPYLFLYVEEPIYYWPEWLRFPLSQCPPCMASVGGTLLYWPVVLSSPHLFDWYGWDPVAFPTTFPPAWLVIFFWILFCLALSALNKLSYNIIGT